MSRKLFVGNLPFTTGENELQDLFGQAGAIESVRVMRDNATGRARGFAFVEMQTEEDAQTAIRSSTGQTWAGARSSSTKPGRSLNSQAAAVAADVIAAAIAAAVAAAAAGGPSLAGNAQASQSRVREKAARDKCTPCPVFFHPLPLALYPSRLLFDKVTRMPAPVKKSSLRAAKPGKRSL